ncbi:MAG: peptide chain release factor-like protein, partial [Luminiphilus sp.]|nr:peptide chain release factor-like protein [Luminiphilus sp.]
MIRVLDIPESEIVFSAIRASGPGGQNVNKVSSA